MHKLSTWFENLPPGYETSKRRLLRDYDRRTYGPWYWKLWLFVIVNLLGNLLLLWAAYWQYK